MFKTCTILFLVSSVMFFKSTSPFLSSLLLIIMSFFISGLSWVLSSKWMGVSIFFVFVGGMMVVFLYVSSVSMNSKIFISFSITQTVATSAVMGLISVYYHQTSFFSPMFFFSENNFLLISFLVAYLLSALFVSSKLAESLKGSLSQKF